MDQTYLSRHFGGLLGIVFGDGGWRMGNDISSMREVVVRVVVRGLVARRMKVNLLWGQPEGGD